MIKQIERKDLSECVKVITQSFKTVAAVNWDSISDKKKQEIDKATDKLARKISKKHGTVKPGIKTRFFFEVMRMMQKNGFNERDVRHWKEHGWLEKKRPWKK